MKIDLNKFIYVGFFLDDESKDKLKNVFIENVKDDILYSEKYKMYLDHCTMIYNDHNLNDDKSKNIINYIKGTNENKKYKLTIDAIGYYQNVCAFRVVKNYQVRSLVKNNQPHITICLEPKINKPADSNKITKWEDLDFPITVTTHIKVISKK